MKLGFIAGLLAMSMACAAQEGGASRPVPPAPSSAELEVFFDGLIPYALRQSGVPGAAISIVKDGEILFAKGYGVANIEARRAVSAEATLFRSGSVSKLVTWTAVMQLVERGAVDLDADVGRYLDFKIPDPYGQPITLRHLLTHTAGFEEVSRGMGSAHPIPDDLSHYVRTHIPTRIFAPGERIAYSNYGATLAGYVVRRVSGLSFEEYTKRYIFDPLGMHRSTFVQPLPPELADAVATGYESTATAEAEPFATVTTAPAGAMSTTAVDMARFMIAHLGGGTADHARILRPETLELMHRRHHQAAPGRNGFALGFWEASRNGWRIIGHSGDVASFHANLHLVPEAGYGIFVALNGTGERGRRLGSDVVRSAVFEQFVDRYLPGPVQASSAAAWLRSDAKRVAGYYRSTRRNESVMSLRLLFQGDDRVTALDDGSIEVSSRLMPSGSPKRWRQVAPLVFQERDGPAHLSFVEDAQGRILYWISDDYPPAMVFERLSGLRGSGLVQPFLYLSLMIVVPAVITAVLHRFRRPSAHRHRLWLLSTVGIGLQAVVLMVHIFWVLPGDVRDDQLGLLNVLRALGILGIAAAGVVTVHAMAVLKDRTQTVTHRSGELLTALASLFLAWCSAAYGVVNFSSSF